MPSAGFEPAIPSIKRMQTYALDRTAIGIGVCIIEMLFIVAHQRFLSPKLLSGWKKRWDRCIASRGDYFEGNSA
jgi:hypothetical protein